MIPKVVYLLCALMSTACAFLLLRGHSKSKSRLLLWGGLCFGLLALNNMILVLDLIIIPEIDFHGGIWRNAVGALAGVILLYGLIWELT